MMLSAVLILRPLQKLTNSMDILSNSGRQQIKRGNKK